MLTSDKMREFVKPDVILQINPRVTSKRVQTMLESAALDDGAAWACVSASERRADPGHCVSLHVACDAPRVAKDLVGLLNSGDCSDSRGGVIGRYGGSSNARSCVRFKETLLACDAAASREACAALRDIEAAEGISEMAVALAVTENLPPSAGLFIGNSMPIRDVDMLSGIRRRNVSRANGSTEDGSGVTVQALGSGAGPGAPVCANRGASGIDGVVSAAAGYAAGLGRPVTLLIGDVSFQHDANGLLLLRERPGQPPVTVVVVNNGGGGIFSFLPVADQIDSGAFTKLFATPPDVSRRGLCDAHRVAHSHPSTPAALKRALDAAWSEGRHSVVEVTTSRARNLEQHRALQARVGAAAACALRLREAQSSGTPRVVSASVRGFELPMLKKPTTKEGEAKETAGVRRGHLLRVELDDGRVGWGEASPLPGLHAESAEDAGAQLRAMAALLDGGDRGGVGVFTPPELPILGGGVSDWLRGVVGVVDPDVSMLPSVRFAVESAVLSALASPDAPLADVLLLGAEASAEEDRVPDSSSGDSSVHTQPETTKPHPWSVEINALIEANLTPEAAAAQALALVRAGHGCLKLKVARGEGSAGAFEDAARLRAIRDAVGPHVSLRADANRRWSLNDALSFGLQAADVRLEYIEEPVSTLFLSLRGQLE
jgi:isochorismate synthase/2-succinyl-5-enolpyruvyl-6-hydroxy-3-cyclohexene-1-carboxylate synthase/2-succinyl-6-hydroxy-2,4-cyclohexadiene-1-carboxylate synthase/O-succinylbenzoate synthase